MRFSCLRFSRCISLIYQGFCYASRYSRRRYGQWGSRFLRQVISLQIMVHVICLTDLFCINLFLSLWFSLFSPVNNDRGFFFRHLWIWFLVNDCCFPRDIYVWHNVLSLIMYTPIILDYTIFKMLELHLQNMHTRTHVHTRTYTHIAKALVENGIIKYYKISYYTHVLRFQYFARFSYIYVK